MTSTPQPPLRFKVPLPSRASFLAKGVHQLELVLQYGHLEEHVLLVDIHGNIGLPPQNEDETNVNSSPSPSNRKGEIVDSSGDDPLPSPPSREEPLIPTSSRFKRYFCSTCEKQFTSRHTLLRHLSSSHANQEEKITARRRRKMTQSTTCQICHKIFANKSHAAQHSFVHLSQEEKEAIRQGWKNKCYFCSKRFRDPSKLDEHLFVHTKEKPHPCPNCDKQFNRKSDLTRHQRLHDPDPARRRPFHCEECGTSFTRRCDLTRHVTTVHRRRLEEFQCGKCDGKFREKSSLEKHLSGIHLGIRYPCHKPNCGKSFCQIVDLRGHEKKDH